MKTDETQRELSVAAFEKHGGNVSAAARELGISRASIRRHVQKSGKHKKPLVGGSMKGTAASSFVLPPLGKVKRYILTSAQNNTRLNEKLWKNLLALTTHYRATLMVGTYSYNKNAYGALAVKRGTTGERQQEVWYDERLVPYLCDVRIELANGLMWCGEMNILPTAIDPLEGLETYSHRKSAIFPHAKLALRSIPTMKGEGTKINYTTGTVTQRNYVQKKAGLVAEHHHSYGALLVEVDDKGYWWVRQLDSDDKGRIYDLNLLVDNGEVKDGQRVEAVTWGDLHATTLASEVVRTSLDQDLGILAVLRPKYQFIHDLLEGVSINHHAAKDPHELFRRHMRGFSTVETELENTSRVLKAYERPWCQTVVVDSNHDNWLMRWLREHDYRTDPQNAMLFLEAQLHVYRHLGMANELNLTRWCMKRHSCPEGVRFLRTDESFRICNDRIECGMHGHLGPNGARGNARNLAKVGRRANIGHTHSAEIRDGLYVAGTSTTLDMGYNRGPTSWTHTHIITYPNGKRTLITIFAGKWRAYGSSL